MYAKDVPTSESIVLGRVGFESESILRGRYPNQVSSVGQTEDLRTDPRRPTLIPSRISLQGKEGITRNNRKKPDPPAMMTKI